MSPPSDKPSDKDSSDSADRPAGVSGTAGDTSAAAAGVGAEAVPTLTNVPGLAPPAPTKTIVTPGIGGAGGILPEQFGRYKIEKTLGHGGMGAVYLAEDTELKRRVALKVPLVNAANAPRVLARFRREARSAATLAHPNICPVYDVGEIDGIHFLTMAFIEGQPLSALIPRGKGMDPIRAADFAYRIALALEEAHQKGIIHRDLKPSNVMVNARSEPVIMDFGLAYLDAETDARLTQSGAALGTPCYMDPEQLTGEVDAVLPAWDVYSLGVLLYEMLTGRLPFTGKTPAQIMARSMVEEPVPPSCHRPELDPRLEAICLKAMARRSSDRYRTMASLAAALEPIVWNRSSPAKLSPISPATMPQGDISTETRDSDHAQMPTMDLEEAPRRRRPAPPPPSAEPKRRAPKWVAVVLIAALPVVAVGGVAVVLLRTKDGALQDTSTIAVAPSPVESTPPPSTASLPEPGRIGLRLSDSEAEVTVSVDNAPVPVGSSLHLAPGRHKLKIVGVDIDPVEKEFTVRSGTNPDLEIRLATFGLIRLMDSDPGQGVTARLDRQPIDTAALIQPRRLSTGPHVLEIEGKDIDPVVRKFEVRRGTNPALSVALQEYGTVQLAGDALDADCSIKLDRKNLTKAVAKAPLRLKVGSHTVAITGEYIDPIEHDFRIVRGTNVPMKLDAKFYGDFILRLSPDMKSAELQIDQKPVPSFQPGKALRLAVGPHHLRISAAGFQPREQDVLVRRGLNPVRTLPLERIDPIAIAAKKFANSLDMELVRIEAGTVTLGSPSEQEGHRENEERRKETIARPFYLGAHEVTVGAFRTFAQKAKYKTDAERTGKGAWRFDAEKGRLVQDPECTWEKPGWKQSDDEPVVCVTWDDTNAFCQWLSKQEGRKYRLPTEAEWEYACRAGSDGPFHVGDSLNSNQANFDGKRPYGTDIEGPARKRTMKVGSFKPNDWGLYDMHGNVWEWCADVYRKSPSAPPRPTIERVMRGGSWFDPAVLCRAAYRSFDSPSVCSPTLGFRIVCEAK